MKIHFFLCLLQSILCLIVSIRLLSPIVMCESHGIHDIIVLQFGFEREGLLRGFVREHDGSYSPNVLLSLLSPEWPVAKKSLEAAITASKRSKLV